MCCCLVRVVCVVGSTGLNILVVGGLCFQKLHRRNKSVNRICFSMFLLLRTTCMQHLSQDSEVSGFFVADFGVDFRFFSMFRIRAKMLQNDHLDIVSIVLVIYVVIFFF